MKASGYQHDESMFALQQARLIKKENKPISMLAQSTVFQTMILINIRSDRL